MIGPGSPPMDALSSKSVPPFMDKSLSPGDRIKAATPADGATINPAGVLGLEFAKKRVALEANFSKFFRVAPQHYNSAETFRELLVFTANNGSLADLKSYETKLMDIEDPKVKVELYGIIRDGYRNAVCLNVNLSKNQDEAVKARAALAPENAIEALRKFDEINDFLVKLDFPKIPDEGSK